MTVIDYWPIVEEAIKKYAKNSDELQDIRQTVYLALLETIGLTKRKAVKIARETVVQYNKGLQSQIKELSISEPSIFRIADETRAKEFDVSEGLDTTRIESVIDYLPDADRIIVKMFFGVGCEPQTLERISWWLGKPEIWIRRRKKLALKKLRIMLGEKSGNRAEK